MESHSLREAPTSIPNNSEIHQIHLNSLFPNYIPSYKRTLSDVFQEGALYPSNFHYSGKEYFGLLWGETVTVMHTTKRSTKDLRKLREETRNDLELNLLI